MKAPPHPHFNVEFQNEPHPRTPIATPAVDAHSKNNIEMEGQGRGKSNAWHLEFATMESGNLTQYLRTFQGDNALGHVKSLDEHAHS